jgi:hypothetical protein
LSPEEITTRSGEMPTPASSIAGSMPVWRIREVIELAWGDPDALHLEVGESDLPTPEHVVDALGPQYGQLGAMMPLLRARFDLTSGQPRRRPPNHPMAKC